MMVDSREPDTFPPALEELGVPVERRQLEVGDFWFQTKEEMVVITRKSSDLMPSLYSNHFQDELARCMAFIESSGGGRLIYLQEGVWSPNYGGGLAYYKRSGPQYYRRSQEVGGSGKALVGIQLSLQAAGLWHVHTGDHHETINALAGIYRRALDGWPSNLSSAPVRPALKWTQDSRVAHLRGLWPRLNESVAESLIDRHGSIASVVEYVLADPKKAVKETPGLGKKGVESFMEVWNGS